MIPGSSYQRSITPVPIDPFATPAAVGAPSSSSVTAGWPTPVVAPVNPFGPRTAAEQANTAQPAPSGYGYSLPQPPILQTAAFHQSDYAAAYSQYPPPFSVNPSSGFQPSQYPPPFGSVLLEINLLFPITWRILVIILNHLIFVKSMVLCLSILFHVNYL